MSPCPYGTGSGTQLGGGVREIANAEVRGSGAEGFGMDLAQIWNGSLQLCNEPRDVGLAFAKVRGPIEVVPAARPRNQSPNLEIVSCRRVPGGGGRWVSEPNLRVGCRAGRRELTMRHHVLGYTQMFIG